MNDGDEFEFITHSMGAAFGEGMISYLKERGYKVRATLHINPFQAHDIKANKYKEPDLPWAGQEKTDLIVDYQNMNDPVINNAFRSSPGEIKNADATYRVFSTQDLTKIHRDPIDKGATQFWEAIMTEVNKFLNSGK